MLKRSFVVLVLVGLVGCSPTGEALPQLGIDVKQTSASGLSAGAYMAGQLQVAHSSQIIGAALVAGGPYGCAETGSEGPLPAYASLTRNGTSSACLVKDTPKLVPVAPCRQLGCETTTFGISIFVLA